MYVCVSVRYVCARACLHAISYPQRHDWVQAVCGAAAQSARLRARFADVSPQSAEPGALLVNPVVMRCKADAAATSCEFAASSLMPWLLLDSDMPSSPSVDSEELLQQDEARMSSPAK